MSTPILATKLYIPPPRLKVVIRPRLIERLNEGLHHKLTLISAPAGFGKTTLVSDWVSEMMKAEGGRMKEAKLIPYPSKVAWLSLDEGDNDPNRFLAYLVAALQTVKANIGIGVLGALQSPQPPPIDAFLIALLNEITTILDNFVLVLDDYHVTDAKPVNDALTFLIEHLPPQMRLVIATREDPDLPLARLRGRGQLTELRAADLRFTPSEAAEFFNQAMGLTLSTENITALETRTEGWIAGLQLAAISMQGQQDATRFIQSFTGSHRFVMDYLVEEVLQQQPESLQTFLLYTSILDRMCGPLCDAVLLNTSTSGQETDGQETLEYIEHANLFVVPLDNERRWYRYHHLFADLLRQRLPQSFALATRDAESHVQELHIRASQWFEDNELAIEAFQHAAATDDVERAERLAEGKGIPLHLSGGVAPILEWLETLPKTVKDARPSLWWRHAALLLVNGQTIGVGEKLLAAEAGLAALLQGAELDDKTQNLIGQIAAARATLALTRYDTENMLGQARRALEYLPLTAFNRATAYWAMGYAYVLLGDRIAARRALMEGISFSQKMGAMFTLILATIGLGLVQELDNQLHQAAETYRRVLQWAGDHPQQIINEAHLGLARILYEWNDLEAAQRHGEQSLTLARQYEQIIDRHILAELFLARLKLARGDVDTAATMLAKTDQQVREKNFVHRIPEIVSAQVPVLLRQGKLAAAAQLAQLFSLPLSQARVHLAQGDPSAALAVLEPLRQETEAKGWQDQRLKVMVLQALAYHGYGDKDKAMQVMGKALALTEPEGFIRSFVDEGEPMRLLILDLAQFLRLGQLRIEEQSRGLDYKLRGYIDGLLAAFTRSVDTLQSEIPQSPIINQKSIIVEPLSPRELEVLQLIAKGLSNEEISGRLFLALSTVKGHNRIIFDKLQVQRRTEAVARARELGLL